MYRQVNLELLQRFDPLALSPLVEDQKFFYYFIKRGMDIILAILLLLLLMPIMVLISILIVIDSRGPVIFSQTRIGAKRWTRNGFSYWQRTEFKCHKFRTLVKDADPSVHQNFVKAFVEGCIEPSDTDETKFKLCNDKRVTRIGRVLRKTSLDELPQLFNILWGEMSLVGPRPDVPYAVEDYQSWHCERLAALPGLTGLWQTKGRSSVAFDDMARLDIEYVRNQSLLMDLKILVLTIPAVLSGHGAV
jgi:lipopolysaccharide/colanic/teichoic acid biosynthesis glycosyltransferase